MKNILIDILQAKKNGQKLLAILVDPDKINLTTVDGLVKNINHSPATHLLVGGSIVQSDVLDQVIEIFRSKTTLPVVLFPGDPSQISRLAHGILFLNLISGRNSTYLIDFQVQAAPLLVRTDLEVIPTAYLLIDGDRQSAVELVSNTKPMPQKDLQHIVNTAKAGEFMGNRLVYLEAGSGAKAVVSPRIIASVSQALSIPVIVGGGIRSYTQAKNAFDSGADMVVIGTAFEDNPEFFASF